MSPALFAAVLLTVFIGGYAASSAFIPDAMVESWTQDIQPGQHENEHP